MPLSLKVVESRCMILQAVVGTGQAERMGQECRRQMRAAVVAWSTRGWQHHAGNVHQGPDRPLPAQQTCQGTGADKTYLLCMARATQTCLHQGQQPVEEGAQSCCRGM